MPSSSPAPLRDFLYLDSDRVRSLLAQLDGGIVSEVVERSGTSATGEAGARFLGLANLRAALTGEQSTQRTKTVEDALFFTFEEAAEAQGLLSEPELPTDPSAWRQGDVHAFLKEGQLLRSRAPTRIIDAQLFRERTERFVQMMEVNSRLGAADDSADSETVPGGDADDESVDFIADIGRLYAYLMADQIAIRQFPCGLTATDVTIGGTLLPRPGFLQDEREALFGRYGSSVGGWTLVSQVASLPTAQRVSIKLPPDIDDENERPGLLRRLQFEQMAAFGLQTLEEQGFVEAPQFPAVHVTPLAVYRQVPS